MKIILIGASGTLGKNLCLLLGEKHKVISAGRKTGSITVDMASEASVRKMFNDVKNIDACVCVAGDSYTGDLLSMTAEQLALGINNKVIGQVNLVLVGQHYLNDNGSFTLISGKMGEQPVIGSAAKAIANGAINSFVLAASLELPRGIRINVISPAKAADIAVDDLLAAYLKSIEGNATGEIIKVNY